MTAAEKAAETIHARMAAVLADLPAISKASKAPANMGGYSFRGIEDILNALKPVLAKHGVFVVPRTLDRLENGRSLSGGKTMYVVDVHVEWQFYGPAGDSVTASAWGQGTDMGDKATQKAYTSAFKSMLSQVFCIADENTDAERHDVPDSTPARHAPPSPPPADPEKLSELKHHIGGLSDEQKTALKATWREAGLTSMAHLTEEQVARVWQLVQSVEAAPATEPEPEAATLGV